MPSFTCRSGRAAALGVAVLSICLGVLAACTTSWQSRQAVSSTGTVAGTAALKPSPLPSKVPSTPLPPTATLTPTVTPTPLPPLAAIVNGQYIFLADYEWRESQYQQALLARGLDPDTQEGQAELSEARKSVLESLIDYTLVEQAAPGLGVQVADAELDAQVQADVSAGGGQAEFDAWLDSTGQTRAIYRETLRQSMLSQSVFEAVTARVSETAEQVHARDIVTETQSGAQKILAWLQGGADFAELARLQSADVATKASGGDLGWFPRGLTDPVLEKAAFGLQPGEVSGVLVVGGRYHVLEVVEREKNRRLSSDDLLDLKRAVFDQWLARQHAAATIERSVKP